VLVTQKNAYYWWYNGLCIFATFVNGALNGMFLWFAYWDAKRRIWIMRYVSGSLELDFHTKDVTGIRFPTLNFMDTQSLLTWLETRKMVLEMGERF